MRRNEHEIQNLSITSYINLFSLCYITLSR